MAQESRGREIPRTLTASEAAALIGVSVATVRGWADNGLIPSHRTIGGHRRFELSELREWLESRGAPAAERLRPRQPGGMRFVPCPRLARDLNGRTDALIDRVLAGYADEVPTRVPPSTRPALQRSITRFIRVVTGALDAGSLETTIGRAELAGMRAGLQGEAGLGVLAEFTRVAIAMVGEAEDMAAEGRLDEENALPTLISVVESVELAIAGSLIENLPRRSPL